MAGDMRRSTSEWPCGLTQIRRAQAAARTAVPEARESRRREQRSVVDDGPWMTDSGGQATEHERMALRAEGDPAGTGHCSGRRPRRPVSPGAEDGGENRGDRFAISEWGAGTWLSPAC
jgi:hypothetical protein